MGLCVFASWGGVVLESWAHSHSCGQVKWNKNGTVYVLISTVTMTLCDGYPFLWPQLEWVSFGKTLLIWHALSSCTFNTLPSSPPVTMYKPVNRIFQSSCGVLLSEWTVCQRKGCQLPFPTEQEVTSNAVGNSDEPLSGERGFCLSAACFLLTFSGSIYTPFITTLKFLSLTGSRKSYSNNLSNRRPKQANKAATSHPSWATCLKRQWMNSWQLERESESALRLRHLHPNWFSTNPIIILTGLF